MNFWLIHVSCSTNYEPTVVDYPEYGLLYKIISVEEKSYPGQGTYIVGYRAYVFPNGKVSLKPSREAYNIRDLEVYYNDYIKKVKPIVNKRHIELSIEDKKNGVASLRPCRRNRNSGCGGKRTRVSSEVISRKSPRLHTSSACMSSSINDNIRYNINTRSNSSSDEYTPSHDIEFFLHDNSHIHKLVEHAMLGDALASYVLVNDFAGVTLDPEPNTIKQALSLPDRQSWKEAIDNELQMIKDFNVFSDPMLLPPGAKVLNQRWVFKKNT